ncbi:MAG: replicative DNA helicase [Planctomycetales bacterium]|nr:replicative DNA helicase [Planctomycetales bacterium]
MAQSSFRKDNRQDSRQFGRSKSAEILERQPPCNIEAEMCVLGSILLQPDACDDVAMILRPADFFDEAHQKLYEQMLEMHDGGSRIDAALLVEQLKANQLFDKIGGAAYLAKIANSVPNAAHSVYYSNIVREHSTRRSLIEACSSVLAEAYESGHSARELLSQAEQKVFAILEGRGSSSYHNIRDVLHQAMDRLDARIRGEHTSGGVETGFKSMDELTGGLHNSELVILAARPSMGKTAFALNIAEHAAIEQQAPVLFISLEMSAIELADRMLCSLAQVNGHRLRNGTISKDDRTRLVEKANEIAESPFFVDDSPSRTVTEIAASARRIRRSHGRLGLIVIDYLQLIEPDNASDPRQEQVAKIARRLKGLAREVEVPVLCLAQLNRQAEASKDNRPRLSHLRESGAIEQDADVVMFVHREEYYHTGEEREQVAGEATIIIAKQRNGPIGDIDLLWHKEYTRFVNPAPARYEDLAEF